MPIDAGRLRHRLRIERFADQLNSSGLVIQDPQTGDVTRAWEEVATVWAAIEPLSAREFIQSKAEQSEVVARITIRYRSDFEPTMRFVHPHSGKIYNPQGILADLDSGLEYLTVPCSQNINSGE